MFSEDVLKNKRNTEAVEVAPGTIVAARVIEHKPASVRPFEEVKAAIEKKLVLREAARLAAQEGKGKLELLKQGKDAPADVERPAARQPRGAEGAARGGGAAGVQGRRREAAGLCRGRGPAGRLHAS